MRKAWVAGAIVLLALAPAVRLLWLSRDGPHFGFYHDDTVYWVTAGSIAQGGGYRVPSLPGNPHQTKYPPVFPGMLSLAWLISPQFPASLQTVWWITWPAVPVLILLANRFFRESGVGGRQRTVLCAALALNTYLAFLGTVMLSEVWASCFLLGALILAAPVQVLRWRAALAGVCAALAYLTKTMLAPLLVAIPFALWWRRQRRAALLFLLSALPPAAAWHLWAAAHRGPASDSTWLYYLDYLGYYRSDVTLELLPVFVYQNLGALLNAGGELLLFKLSLLPAGEHVSRLVMIAALAGIIRWVRAARRYEYPLFAALQFVMFLPWNGPPNERFLIPVLPLLLLGLWVEMSHLAGVAAAAWRRREFSQRAAAALAGMLLVVLAAGLVMRNLDATLRVLPSLARARREAAARAQPLYEWIRENTPAGSTFFADRDTTLYLRTGRRGTLIRGPARHFYTEDRPAILAEAARLPIFARARRLDYVLLTPADFFLDPLPEEERRAAREALERDGGFRPVYDSEAGTVLKVETGDR